MNGYESPPFPTLWMSEEEMRNKLSMCYRLVLWSHSLSLSLSPVDRVESSLRQPEVSQTEKPLNGSARMPTTRG